MKRLKIKQHKFGGPCDGLWYVPISGKYLWNDLTLQNSTGYGNYGVKVPGYYATKAEAERYLRAYEVSQMGLIVKKLDSNKWYIVTTNPPTPREKYLHHDLKIYSFAGQGGFWKTRIEAGRALRQFKEKHNMTQDNLEINVKLNGVDTPLHEISEQTLLRIREASKPKPVPVFQVCDVPLPSGYAVRLVLKITEDMANCVGNYIAIHQDGSVMSRYVVPGNDCLYANFRELKLDKV